MITALGSTSMSMARAPAASDLSSVCCIRHWTSNERFGKASLAAGCNVPRVLTRACKAAETSVGAGTR